MILNEIASIFSINKTSKNEEENNSEYKATFIFEKLCTIDHTKFKSTINEVPDRDNLSIRINFDHQDDIYIDNFKDDHIVDFFNSIKRGQDLSDEEDQITLDIKITKNVENNSISIYSLTNLAKFWLKDGLINSFSKIKNLTDTSRIFRVYNYSKVTKSNYLAFTPFNSDFNIHDDIDRQSILSKRNSCCHFSNSSDLNFIPNDFNLNNKTDIEILDNLFNDLKSLSSLIFICNYSKIKGTDYALLRLEGYKNYEEKIVNCEAIEHISSDYYNIYDWAYNEGNISDKLDLARNIISLHIIDKSIFQIERATLSAIISSHRIYLKENIKQYIEVKNKLSEFIQDSSNKVSDVAKSTSTYFKNSIWTLYSFFASIILFRLLAKNSNSPLISNEILVFYLGFTIITLIIMAHALMELKEDKARIKKSYNSLKNRYMDILDESNLKSILDNDSQHIEDLNFLDKKYKDYRLLWGKSLSVLTMIILLIWLSKA